MLDRICRLPWRSSFPRSGSCCVSKSPRGFLYLSAGCCCDWQHWWTCKGFFLPPPQKNVLWLQTDCMVTVLGPVVEADRIPFLFLFFSHAYLPLMGSVWPAAWAHKVRLCPQLVGFRTVRASQHSRPYLGYGLRSVSGQKAPLSPETAEASAVMYHRRALPRRLARC